MKGLKRVFPLVLVGLFATVAQAATPPSKQDADLDRLVDAVVAYYHLPGLAVGVIDHGKVVYTREVGKLASGKPIDNDTLFEIASNTKAMTSTSWRDWCSRASCAGTIRSRSTCHRSGCTTRGSHRTCRSATCWCTTAACPKARAT